MKTKLLFYFLMLVLAAGSVVSCSKDEDRQKVEDWNKTFSLSNYAFDLTNVQGLAISNSSLSKSMQVEGELCIYDDNGQLLPITLKVSDKFVQVPDSIVPPEIIKLEAHVFDSYDLDRYIAFRGNFSFRTDYTYNYIGECLFVDKQNGNLYDFTEGFPFASETMDDGTIYALVQEQGGPTIKRITTNGNDIVVEQLLANQEMADRVHIDKNNNILYFYNRIKMANGEIVLFKNKDNNFPPFVSSDGDISYIIRGEDYYWEDDRIYYKYLIYKILSNGEEEFVASSYEEGEISFHDYTNRGAKTFFMRGTNIACFDITDNSFKVISYASGNYNDSKIRIITPKYYYTLSGNDNKLYRFNFETCEMDTFGEDYQFYDLSPYGENQAQFHGMRFSDGHEVYGIIDGNGNINIINDNGDFKSVTIQPL